jgi:hypothetical protein
MKGANPNKTTANTPNDKYYASFEIYHETETYLSVHSIAPIVLYDT